MKFGIGLTIGVLLTGMTGATAADMKLPSSPPMPTKAAMASLLTWTGPYLGVQAGYLSGRAETSFPATGEFHFVDPKGAQAGGSVGYSVQWGRIVTGIEGDLNFVDAKATINTGLGPDPTVSQVQSAIDWNGHLRGRLGYAFDRTLLFATGGVAIARVESRAIDNAAGVTASWNDTRIGWSLGGGVEYRFVPQASLRLEYVYDNYGSKTLGAQTIGVTTFGARDSKLDTHTLRGGVYWHF